MVSAKPMEGSGAWKAGKLDPISSRAGLLPISLSHLPIQALAGIPVYLRTDPAEGTGTGQSGDSFTLFSAGSVLFDETCRQRCLNLGVRFVYIPISCHDKFRTQTECGIEDIARDTEMASAAKWAIVYETTSEIANELLSQRNFGQNLPRLQAVSKAVSSVVLRDASAFSHLFAASHHDFYTATHMVNVGTWMVALAYAMGFKDEQDLCAIFQAGILHDVGKMVVPREILNKTGQLTAEEWAMLRSHPAEGCEYLQNAGVNDPIILAVTRQHHERLDGSGYPDGLRGTEIHPIGRLCAVIDTFDAMTSLRPFKTRALSVAEAMEVICKETPSRYDSEVVAAWTTIVKTVDPAVSPPATPTPQQRERRKVKRFAFRCPALVRIKEDTGRFEDAVTINAEAHDISAAGMAVLMPVPLASGQLIRLTLQPPHRVRVGKTYTCVCVRCRTYDDGWYEVGVKFRADKTLAA